MILLAWGRLVGMGDIGQVYFFELEDDGGNPLGRFVGVDLSIVESAQHLIAVRTFGDADAAAAFFRDHGGRFKGHRLRFRVEPLGVTPIGVTRI
jgi:hypothetical protein